MSSTVTINEVNDLVDGASSQKFQVPNFVEIEEEADRYGDSHRFLVQFLMKNGVITKKTLCVAFIRYFVTTVLNRDYSVISKIQANSSQLELLAYSLIESLNKKTAMIGLRIALTKREDSGTEVVVLLSERQYSDAMLSASGYTSDEVFLLTHYITEMLKGDGCVSLSWALQAAKDLPNPLTHLKAQLLIDKLESEKWITIVDDDLWLEPRTIAELEPLLRTKYKSPICPLCEKIVIRKSSAINCKTCGSYIHLNCWEKLTALTTHDEVECPGLRTSGCKEFLKIGLESRRSSLQTQSKMTVKNVRKRTVHTDNQWECEDEHCGEGRRSGLLKKVHTQRNRK